MCGWDASATDIGEAGAVALAKALESGQFRSYYLNLFCESTLIAKMRCSGLRLFFSSPA